MKEDRKTAKLVQKPCLFSQRATRQSQRLRRAIKSRTRATKSRDKIAGVTSVLVDTPQWAWSVTAAFNVVIRKLTHESTQMQQSLSVYNILPGRSTYLFFQLYGAVDCYFR